MVAPFGRRSWSGRSGRLIHAIPRSNTTVEPVEPTYLAFPGFFLPSLSLPIFRAHSFSGSCGLRRSDKARGLTLGAPFRAPSAAPFFRPLIWWLCTHLLQHVSARQTRPFQFSVVIVSVPISVGCGRSFELRAEHYRLH